MEKEHQGAGRPPKFKTKEEMQEKIDKYFGECKKEKRPITFTGLAYSIGLSRQGLLEYKAKDEFSDTVKKAREYVEMTLEERLIGTSGIATGIIFNLKNNYNWKDKQEVDANINATNIHVTLEDDKNE